MKISLLINKKMQTIVGIFIFVSREKFKLSWVKHEKGFLTSGPGVHLVDLSPFYIFVFLHKTLFLLLLLCGCVTLPGTRGTWRQQQLLCICIVLLSWITDAPFLPLSTLYSTQGTTFELVVWCENCLDPLQGNNLPTGRKIFPFREDPFSEGGVGGAQKQFWQIPP